MSDAFKGGWGFFRGDADTGSTVWTKVGEIIALSGIGAQGSDVDVTNADSGNTREFIAGLLDGAEITVEGNLVLANSPQQAMTTDAQNGTTWEFQVPVTDGATTMTLTFQGAVKGWQLAPSIEEQNKIQWNVKISGSIDIAYT